ncbi:SIR2 family protein [Heliobacterium chlorum]|uniref:SIR2 family protein n=1 Tax=Heliobacterium chlorum TaxID=2698 RepID=A0ABR7T947_HELCL|nr:SIR2 family protein [Heliobacterium chlorum]MBC9786595.1 SIR2 family protein [Heliobacterium chlorum]
MAYNDESIKLVFDTEPTNENTLKKLSKQLKTTVKVIPFVGAGMSVPFGFPEWGKFLLLMAKSRNMEKETEELIRIGKYEEAAELLYNEMKHRAFNDELTRYFGDDNIANNELKGAVTYIPRLASSTVVTTNFDHVLENVFEQAGCSFKHAVWDANKRDLIIAALHQDQRVLFKLHGDVDNHSDRILTLTEYQKAYGNQRIDLKRPIPKLLGDLLTNRPLLFLGCSLNQDRTVAMLRQVTKDRKELIHYAITEKPNDNNEFIKKRRHLSEHSISPIWYPESRHELIPDILAYLLEKDDVIKNTISEKKHISKTAPNIEERQKTNIFPHNRVGKSGNNLWKYRFFALLLFSLTILLFSIGRTPTPKIINTPINPAAPTIHLENPLSDYQSTYEFTVGKKTEISATAEDAGSGVGAMAIYINGNRVLRSDNSHIFYSFYPEKGIEYDIVINAVDRLDRSTSRSFVINPIKTEKTPSGN